jgi:acetyltransferase-like isoleucine patch superfamily enzyme
VPAKGFPKPLLTIGDNTNIEQNVHIICRSRVRIGNRVSITGNCAIVDVTHPYENVGDPKKIGERVELVDRPVEIGDDTFVGMSVMILPGSTIGRYCVIGAGSIVDGAIPDYSVAVGRPAKVVRRYDLSRNAWVRVGGPPERSDTE